MVLIVQKIDLIQKYFVSFPNFKIKNLWLVLFYRLETWTKLPLNCTRKCCWSVRSLYVWMVIVVFREINDFSKFFQVVNIKSAGFSKLETQFLRFETWLIRVLSILPVLNRHAIAYSQTLYFLFKVRRAPVIKKKKGMDLLTTKARG